MTSLKTVLRDQSLWVTLAALVAAVLTTAGLGHIAPTVQAVIDAATGLVSAIYVGGQAHLGATTITANTASATPAGNDVASIAEAAAAQVLDAIRSATTPAAHPTPSG